MPDGYTLVVSGLGPLVIAPALAAKAPFDPVKDFTHIALFGGPPSVLGVHPSLPAHDVKGFIALAKAKPGAMSYGSRATAARASSSRKRSSVWPASTSSTCPIKGAAIAVSDLAGGHIHAISVTLTTTALADPQRQGAGACDDLGRALPDYPDVPTFRELGFPQLVASVWFSLSGPPGMPPDIVNRLNAEVRRILQLPDVRERLRPHGDRARHAGSERVHGIRRRRIQALGAAGAGVRRVSLPSRNAIITGKGVIDDQS